MKLHLALAGLALISPFAAVAQGLTEIVATAGKDDTKPDVYPNKVGAGDIVARAIDASNNAKIVAGQRSLLGVPPAPFPPDQEIIFTKFPGFEVIPGDICFKTIRRTGNLCGDFDVAADTFNPVSLNSN
jgi:hypothetical protein